MSREHLVEWRDPTANRALNMAYRDVRGHRVDPDFPDGRILPVCPQAQIDGKIHALRQALAAGEINHANYRSQMDPLRSARRQLQGGSK